MSCHEGRGASPRQRSAAYGSKRSWTTWLRRYVALPCHVLVACVLTACRRRCPLVLPLALPPSARRRKNGALPGALRRSFCSAAEASVAETSRSFLSIAQRPSSASRSAAREAQGAYLRRFHCGKRFGAYSQLALCALLQQHGAHTFCIRVERLPLSARRYGLNC